jgi:microcystin degradation protein MlrC
LIALADEQLKDERVLTNSVLLGFPYADVTEMGSATICVTDNDPQLAEKLARQLADWMWDHRNEFVGRHTEIDEALDSASKMDGPICLLDMGDNVGGGSPADGTFLAHAIHQRQMPASFVCLFDPDAVALAANTGIGNRVQLTVGGKTDAQHGEPLVAEFTVLGVYDGRFEEHEPRHGGMRSMDQGQTAVVRTDHGLTIMLTSRRMPPFSLRQLTTFGIDPSQFHILVAKGVNAPLAAYRPVCRNFIRVNTPGSTVADMTMLDFHNRRRPMYPFEKDVRWADRSSNK